MNATCQSLTPSLIKVIDNFTDDYQEFRENAGDIFVETIIPEKSDSEEALNDLTDQAIALQSGFLKAYGMIMEEKKDKMSARYLMIPSKKITGTLSAQRIFIVTPSPFDIVTINVQKIKGIAGIDTAICAKYTNGLDFLKKMKFIEKGEDTQGETVQFVFTKMVKKVLTIHMVKTGDATHTCDFSLSIKGAFDQVTMEKISAIRQDSGIARPSLI